MHEFLAIIATFGLGLGVTAALAVGLEHRQLANSQINEDADVRPGIIAVSASGYAVSPAPRLIQLGFQPDRLPTDL